MNVVVAVQRKRQLPQLTTASTRPGRFTCCADRMHNPACKTDREHHGDQAADSVRSNHFRLPQPRRPKDNHSMIVQPATLDKQSIPITASLCGCRQTGAEAH